MRVFNEYGKKSFDKNDLERLLEVSKRLSRSNLVVVSYRDCTEFRSLFSGYVVDAHSVVRSVSGSAKNRKSDEELIAVLGA